LIEEHFYSLISFFGDADGLVLTEPQVSRVGRLRRVGTSTIFPGLKQKRIAAQSLDEVALVLPSARLVLPPINFSKSLPRTIGQLKAASSECR
jgi:hypothetical protein